MRSEVRDSTKEALIEKVRNDNYGRYLRRLVIKKLRGFEEQVVDFAFPVTAIVGPNGGGKTTVLGAAACAYKEISPKVFFAKSGTFDDSMQDWSIEYDLIDRRINKNDRIRRTASFRNFRWRRGAPKRDDAIVFGVSRTVPANERKELQQCASSTFTVPADRIEEFSTDVKTAVGRILDKEITQFRRIRVDTQGRVTLLTGETSGGTAYSEFHFGAGESSVIRMVSEIEAAPEQSLFLIEEIENGLHPVATVRMVDYLIETANRRKIQVIFTTHSNHALVPLPSHAVIVATQDRVFTGKLDIGSLRAITGQVSARLAVFVEDAFAKTWVEACLRRVPDVAFDHIEVHAMEGDGTAVVANRHHNGNPAVKTPSVCIIDGDSAQVESVPDRVLRLPGGIPEAHVFDEVMALWDEVGGTLTVALLQPFESAGKVKGILEEVRRSNIDPHNLYSAVGARLGFILPETVAAAFASQWAERHRDAVRDLLQPIDGLIPKETDAA